MSNPRAPSCSSTRDLAATALLGTDRAAGKLTASKLLDESAAAFLRAKAGWRPAQAAPIAACPADPRPAATPNQSALLDSFVSGAYPDAALIEEWAALALARGVSARPASVPAVLDWWARQPRRSETVFAALGQTGEWLASLNPDWHKPVVSACIPADVEANWQTGTGAERAALLVAVRRADAARARALVQSTWADDGADERRRFIEVLADEGGVGGGARGGATMDDEPFLESALDDRSKLVRAAAAKALATIDGSRLVARVSALLAGWVRVEESRTGLLRKKTRTLTIEPPKTWDPAWARDGIEEKPSSTGGVGARTWLLQQFATLVGPARLAASFGMSYSEMLESLGSVAYGVDTVAALHQWPGAKRDEPWLMALVAHEIADERTAAPRVIAMISGISNPTAERAASQVLAARALSMSELASLCHAVPAPWSIPFSTAVIKQFAAAAAGKANDRQWMSGDVLATLTTRTAMSAASISAIESAVNKLDDDLKSQPRILSSLNRLLIRQELHKEFAK